MSRKDELLSRATVHAQQHNLVVVDELGFGVHGIVFLVENQTEMTRSPGQLAIKVHEREPDYRRERDVYLRLREQEVTEIRGCRVPQLIRHDDTLLVLEMTVVTRPFVLDFAGAYLDRAPDFSDEVLADWQAEKREQFGSRWPEVLAILAVLETYGVYMEDVSPSNIAFLD